MLNYKRHKGLGFVGILTVILLVLPLVGVFNSAVLGQETVVTFTPAIETRYIATIDERGAFVRKCPSLECEVIKSIPNQSTIYVSGISNSWLEIRLSDGTSGYVAEYLTSPALPTPVPSINPNAPPTFENCVTLNVPLPPAPTEEIPTESPPETTPQPSDPTPQPTPSPTPCVTVVFEISPSRQSFLADSTRQPTQQFSPTPTATRGG